MTLIATVVVGDAFVHAAPAATTTTTTDTAITVVAGDSLVGLAHRYDIRLSALLRANSMTLTSVIHPGDSMVIPAGATLPTSTPTPRTAVASGASAPSLPTTGAPAGTYTVVAGDALARIAWRHGVKLGALVKANGITVDSLILPGQRLAIPPATMPLPATGTTTSSAGEQAANPSATAAASATGAAGGQSGGASAAPSSIGTVLAFARSQVGVPYRFFAAGPDAYDCSGLVVAAFREAGIALPHQSQALARRGTAVDWTTSSIEPGDLVFTSAFNDPSMITHVGIALDSRIWVQAVGGTRPVSITMLPSDAKIMAVRRITTP